MKILGQLRMMRRGHAGIPGVALMMLLALLLPLHHAANWYHLAAEQHEWSGGNPVHASDHAFGTSHGHLHGEEAADKTSHPQEPDGCPADPAADHDHHHVQDHLNDVKLRRGPTVKLTVHLVALLPDLPSVTMDVPEAAFPAPGNDPGATGPPQGAPPPLRAPPAA